jgi:hypothetical protein
MRALKVVSALALVIAVLQLGRLTVFMFDAGKPEYSAIPSSAWERRHSCLTAYFVAAEAAGQGRDIYDDALYSAADDDPTQVRKPKMMGPFTVDVYEYPPTFLLLPRAFRLLTTDFFRTRPLWFVMEVAVVLVGMVVVARAMGPPAATRALLLAPLVWAGLSMGSTLQKENVQPVVVAAAMLGMVLIERRRYAAGGALLAGAIVSKLYPGALLVYLLARKDWRGAAWTVGMGALFAALALLDLGWAPYAGFLDQLPRLMSGEAFPAFRNPRATAINFSVPGLIFKAKLFGVPGMGFPVARIVGWMFSAVVVWTIWRVAKRPLAEAEKPLVWLAIVVLATLRSPFLPQAYAALPPLWLLTLVAATYAPTARTLLLTLLGWLCFNVVWPLDWAIDPRALALLTGVPQALTVAVIVLALRRKVAPAP